jgi:hypothetical protein
MSETISPKTNAKCALQFCFVLLGNQTTNMPMSVVSYVHDSLEDVICKSETNVKRPDVRDQTKRWDIRDGNRCLWNSFETKRETFFLEVFTVMSIFLSLCVHPHTHKRSLIREAGLRYVGLSKGPWTSCCLDAFLFGVFVWARLAIQWIPQFN